jgi:hypothetical protein
MKYIFIGTESANWSIDNYSVALEKIAQNGYDTVLIKFADGPSLWTSQLNLVPQIKKQCAVMGIEIIPYMFCYGNTTGSSVEQEIVIAKQLVDAVNTSLCLDIEDGFDGAASGDIATLLGGLGSLSTLYISTWANIVDHGTEGALRGVQSRVKAFLPQVYTSYLVGVWQTQYKNISGAIPTYNADTIGHVTLSEFGFWEYQDIAQESAPIVLKLDRGMILDTPQTSQFLPGDTQGACGYFAVALCKYAVEPGSKQTATARDIDDFALAQYKIVYGSIDASQENGMNVPELHTALKNAGNLHYYDIGSITASSAQQQDLKSIKRALQAGYPVVAFVSESSVRDLTGDIPTGTPYAWNTAGVNHIITYVGISTNGHLLTLDPANIQGDVSGVNTVRPWPRVYDVATIDNQYAVIVQTPWLTPIPGGEPTEWETNFSAQAPGPNPGEEEQGGWMSTPQASQATDTWALGVTFLKAVYSVELPTSSGIHTLWEQEYQQGHNHGYPISLETHSCDWNGGPIIIQYFSSGDRCEWSNGSGKFYHG